MGAILRQREIIGRRAVAAALARTVEDMASPADDRRPFVAILKDALAAGRAEIRRRFEAEGDATHTVREQSFLIDQLIRVAFDFVAETVYPLANPTAGEKIAIV